MRVIVIAVLLALSADANAMSWRDFVSFISKCEQLSSPAPSPVIRNGRPNTYSLTAGFWSDLFSILYIKNGDN